MIAFALDLPINSGDKKIAQTNLVKYCSYEIRSRINFIQHLMSIDYHGNFLNII